MRTIGPSYQFVGLAFTQDLVVPQSGNVIHRIAHTKFFSLARIFKVLVCLTQGFFKLTFCSHPIEFLRPNQDILENLGLQARYPLEIQGVTVGTEYIFQYLRPTFQFFDTG